MTPETVIAIHAHALACYPQECAGFVVIENGVETYVECENVAHSKSEHVVLTKTAYADAEDRGEVTAFVHSHPDASAIASEGDRVLCSAGSIPWFIVSVIKDCDQDAPTIRGIEMIEPNGYVAPLEDRSFQFGTLDCYSLVRDVYARLFNIELPDFERRDDFWKRDEDLYYRNFEAAGFTAVSGQPRRGDIILMQIHSQNVANHAGVYLDEGKGLFLHHLYDKQSCKDVYGGYWQHVTRAIIRYKEPICG